MTIKLLMYYCHIVSHIVGLSRSLFTFDDTIIDYYYYTYTHPRFDIET